MTLPSLISFPFTVLASLHSPQIIRPVKAAISRTAMSICCQISYGLFATIRGNFREEKLTIAIGENKRGGCVIERLMGWVWIERNSQNFHHNDPLRKEERG